MIPDAANAAGTDFEGHAFFEAPSIRKIDDIYVLIYSSENQHELCYATSNEPDGRFKYRGTIISNGDIYYKGRTEPLNYTGTNHGSIVEVLGQWYVFYHRQTNGSPYSRQGCAEVFGNPYKDYEVYGSFYSKNEKKTVRGFYDGEGVFIVRFMPSFEGIYTCRMSGNFLLEDIEETFEVLPAGKNSHGVVRTVNQFHFAYDDGTMYYPLGTTCYAWCLQTEDLQKKTLETLSEGPFNKVRFCIFPKHYRYNLKEPACYPYELREDSPWKPEDYREEDLEKLPIPIKTDRIRKQPFRLS